MIKAIYLIGVLFLFSCSTTTYYIVRHGEKEAAGTSADPALTPLGQKQAIALKDFLVNKKISAIYSTNYTRTRATAEPTRSAIRGTIVLYRPDSLASLIVKLKAASGNVLVVGHSNTVDDVVNGLINKKQLTDLADTEYGEVFIVKRKGSTYSFERRKW